MELITATGWLDTWTRAQSGSGHPLTANMWMWSLIGMGIGLIDGNIIGNIENVWFHCNVWFRKRDFNLPERVRDVTLDLHLKSSVLRACPSAPMSVSSLVNSWPALSNVKCQALRSPVSSLSFVPWEMFPDSAGLCAFYDAPYYWLWSQNLNLHIRGCWCVTLPGLKSVNSD